jgi:hypothetical protein
MEKKFDRLSDTIATAFGVDEMDKSLPAHNGGA